MNSLICCKMQVQTILESQNGERVKEYLFCADLVLW